jgi:spermidine/putrescine transport system permease protein
MTAASGTVTRPRARRRGGAALLVLPAALWYLAFLIGPLIVLFVMSLGERSPNGGYAPGFTLEQYTNLTTRITPLTNTLGLAFLNTIICVLVAFPVAYVLALKVRGGWKLALVALVVVPFWTSFLIRTYAWMTLLGNQGVPRLLSDIGLGDIQLLNTPFAVSLGIVYNYLPLMVLPLYAALERVDWSLVEAAQDLGDRPLRAFRRVTLPLALPGVVAGSLLVFIPLTGEYLIPAILGGNKTAYTGTLIAQ